jgi:hypothetical protein
MNILLYNMGNMASHYDVDCSDTTSEAVVSEAVVSEAVVSEAVVSEAVVSEAVVSEAVVSEAVVSEAVVSEAVVSEAVVSEAVVSEAVVSEAGDCELGDIFDNTPEYKPLLIVLKELFPDKKTHVKKLLKAYKKAFPEFPSLEAETIKPMGMDKMEEYLELKRDEFFKPHVIDALLDQSTKTIPALVNFAFVYFIWKFDECAPIPKLPNTLMKFKLLTEVINSDSHVELALFRRFYEDPFLNEIRMDNPPYLMRSTLSKQEIINNINNIAKPVCKMLLELILKDKIAPQNTLDQQKNIKDTTEE